MANRSTPERIAHRTLFDTTVLNSIGKVVITFVCHPTVCSILPGTLQHRPMHARTTTETRENKTHQEKNIDNIDNWHCDLEIIHVLNTSIRTVYSLHISPSTKLLVFSPNAGPPKG